MGILVDRDTDNEVYRDAYEEAQRLFRISDEIRISAERVDNSASGKPKPSDDGKLSTSKMAKLHKIKTAELLALLVEMDHLEVVDERHELTALGKSVGGELKKSSRFGPYFLWPKELVLKNGK